MKKNQCPRTNSPNKIDNFLSSHKNSLQNLLTQTVKNDTIFFQTLDSFYHWKGRRGQHLEAAKLIQPCQTDYSLNSKHNQMNYLLTGTIYNRLFFYPGFCKPSLLYTKTTSNKQNLMSTTSQSSLTCLKYTFWLWNVSYNENPAKHAYLTLPHLQFLQYILPLFAHQNN